MSTLPVAPSRRRTPLVLLVLSSLLAAFALVPAGPARASTTHRARPISAQRPRSAAPTQPTATTQSTARPNAGHAAHAVPLTTYTVSKTVYSFLTTGLGLPLGGSPKLTGTGSGSTLMLTIGRPTKLGLPARVRAPALGKTKIVIDTKANTLTAAAAASGTAPATLNVKIAHANTSTLPARDLTATLSVTATVLGERVPLTGPLTDVAGHPSVTLTGAFASADDVRTGVLSLAKGTAVSVTTTGGLRVKGNATVGAGATAVPVTVDGTVSSASSWTLTVSPPATTTTWKPVTGFTAHPAFAGSVSASGGKVVFDLKSAVAIMWSPVTGATLKTTQAEYANTAPPTGAPSIATGGSWVRLSGTVGVTAGSSGSVDGTGAFVVDPASGSATFTATQQGTLSLSTAPAVVLGTVRLQGDLTVTGGAITGTIGGTGSITVGSAAPANATVTLTAEGVLVVDFTTDLAPFGLGASGELGEVLFASAPISAYRVPSTGKTISLGTGFSSASGTPAGSGDTYVISATAGQFLDSLGLHVPSGALSGPSSGSTITTTVGAPTLPLTLPTGDGTIDFGATKLTVDTATDTLTATASNGSAASLAITIKHVSASTLTSDDLTTAVHVGGIQVFGTAVDVDGSVGWAGGAPFVALTGSIAADVVVVPNLLTVDHGATVGLSTADGLTVAGNVDIGTDPARFTVGFSGHISDLRNWSLSVSEAAGAPNVEPVSGLVISPKFTGTVRDTDGTIGFDISGDDVLTWQPGSSVTLAVTHIEVSNLAPTATLTCPAELHDGDLWIDVSGELNYAPSSSDVNVSAAAEACVAPFAKKFTIKTAAVGKLFAGAGFELQDASLTVQADLLAATFSVKASATIVVTAGGNSASLPIGIAFGSDGTFVAGAAAPDLSSLGLSGTNGYLFVATKAIKNFDPADVGIHNSDGSAIAPFDLHEGVTVTLSITLKDTWVKALQDLHVPINGASVQLVARLSDTGFAVRVEVNFGAGDQGVTLFDSDQGIKLVLDTIFVEFDLSESAVSLSLGGTAFLHVPSVAPGTAASDVEIGISGSINIETLTFSVGVSLSGACGASTCTWHDAFGIQGLSLDSLSGTIGVDFETAIPTPTISLKVLNLVLPDAWASAIGMVPGTRITLALNLSLSQPAVDIEIDPGPGTTVALTPLKVFTSDSNVINQLQIGQAHLIFAPLGATEADGTVLNPGANLVFDAVIGGVPAHVAGSVELSPLNPSFQADVTVGSFDIGPVHLAGPMLHIAIAPLAADISFSGGFTDSTTGIRFAASVDLGVSTSFLNAAVSLEIKAGLPQYLAVDGALSGSVSAGPNGLEVSASGSLLLAIAGFYLSNISVSYSGNASTIWRDLNNDFAAVAAAFVSAYNWSVGQINDALRSLGFDLSQIASAISSAFHEGVTWVIEHLNAAGVAIDDAVQAAVKGLQATAYQVAATLQDLGYQAGQIATMLANDLQAGAAQVYNVLLQIGDAGTTVLNALSSLFNNGSYNLWVADVPDVLDVNGASNDAGAAVIQYVWNGGTNQDWFVLPTDSGYAELVNRNSGQCLSNGGSVDAGTHLVQLPCDGSYAEQWYLEAYGTSPNLTGQQRPLVNRLSTLVADVLEASKLPGASVGQYYYNGGGNQLWTFLPAA